MGKGDKRSFRGKITMGTYGKKRPKKATQQFAAKPQKATSSKEDEAVAVAPKAPKAVKKKTATKAATKATKKTVAKTTAKASAEKTTAKKKATTDKKPDKEEKK